MDVIVAVLKDLYTFAVVYRFGLRSQRPSEVTERADDALVAAFTEKIHAAHNQLTPPKVLEQITAPETTGYEHVGYAYTADTFLYALPTRTFDGVVLRLEYGASFEIVGRQAKWLNVLCGDVKGWINADDVTYSSVALHPKFQMGEYYDETHESTVKLRTLIDDSFHAASLAVPLQNVEYVTYKLKLKNRFIQWPCERPRIGGTWQRLLRGVLGVHIGVTPKTDTVMEYVKEDNTGHVAYVESVYPDGSITISEVGFSSEGQFGERTLPREEWIELRPVYIEVA